MMTPKEYFKIHLRPFITGALSSYRGASYAIDPIIEEIQQAQVKLIDYIKEQVSRKSFTRDLETTHRNREIDNINRILDEIKSEL